MAYLLALRNCCLPLAHLYYLAPYARRAAVATGRVQLSTLTNHTQSTAAFASHVPTPPTAAAAAAAGLEQLTPFARAIAQLKAKLDAKLLAGNANERALRPPPSANVLPEPLTASLLSELRDRGRVDAVGDTISLSDVAAEVDIQMPAAVPTSASAESRATSKPYLEADQSTETQTCGFPNRVVSAHDLRL